MLNIGLVVVVWLAAAALPAQAEQSTNARPVIVYNTAMADPASLTMVGEDARKALGGWNADLKSGKAFAFVLSASANGKTWEIASAQKNNFLNFGDLVRQSLERCEYFAKTSCLILSINGHDARDANGGWPLQPQMLAHGPARFDAARVPFVSLAYRTALAGYATTTGPRALVITLQGSWLWRQGKTEFDAIAAGEKDCKKNNPNDTCLLYAVDDAVVLSSQ